MMVSCGGAGGTGGVVNVDQVLLVSPANGEIGIPVDYELNWSVDDTADNAVFSRSYSRGVSEYRVYFAENTEEGYPDTPFSTLETNYAISGLTAGTCYKWKVEALLDNGEVKASAEKIFTTATGNEMRMIPVSAGTFQMGGETAVDGRAASAHNVTLTKDFYVGTFEVTNAEFVEFLNDFNVLLHDQAGPENLAGYIMKNNHQLILLGIFNTLQSGIIYNNSWRVKTEYEGTQYNYENMPVALISWIGAAEYCNWLSRKNGLEEAYVWDEAIFSYKLRDYPNNTGYRMPTEAEWQYAAIGGENVKWAGTSNPLTVNEYGWFGDDLDWNIPNKSNAHEIGQKKPNEFGLYDMSGNVCEMCSDNFYDYNSNVTIVDPYYQNPINTNSTDRIEKGGSWLEPLAECEITERFDHADAGSFTLHINSGFRVVRTLE